jgi:hypothetical protein
MLHTVHILVAAYVAYYLTAHAMLTYTLWSRYKRISPGFDAFMTCSACSGAWWTLVMTALANFTRHWTFLGLDILRRDTSGPVGFSLGAVGLVLAFGCFLIPLLAFLHLSALRMIHVEPAAAPDPAPAAPDEV